MAAPNPNTTRSKGGSKGGSSKPGLEAERLAKELEAQRARALARAYVKDKGQCVCVFTGAVFVCGWIFPVCSSFSGRTGWRD